MKMTRRILAFTMAVIICVSFCMTHIAATPHESYEWMGDPIEKHFIEGQPSRMKVYCTNYGWNEEVDTDFYAFTIADSVYYANDRQYYAQASVSVGLYYDDEQYWINDYVTEECDATVRGLTAEANIAGNDLIDMDHGIEHFSTNHRIDICINDGGVMVPIDNYGPSIGVTTSY